MYLIFPDETVRSWDPGGSGLETHLATSNYPRPRVRGATPRPYGAYPSTSPRRARSGTDRRRKCQPGISALVYHSAFLRTSGFRIAETSPERGQTSRPAPEKQASKQPISRGDSSAHRQTAPTFRRRTCEKPNPLFRRDKTMAQENLLASAPWPIWRLMPRA